LVDTLTLALQVAEAITPATLAVPLGGGLGHGGASLPLVGEAPPGHGEDRPGHGVLLDGPPRKLSPAFILDQPSLSPREPSVRWEVPHRGLQVARPAGGWPTAHGRLQVDQHLLAQ
jgi:hypothetical protein